MLVTVVVPNLNKGHFLKECLESIFQQDYPEIEVIAIDGGSKDDSIAIFEEYRSRIIHFITEPDDGQAHAINKGFHLAKGDIITWLNSDDIYYPGAIRTAVEIFEKNPQLDLLYGDGLFINENSQALRAFVEVEPYNQYRLRNCSDYIMQPTTFYRKTALESVDYLDESLHFAFDWDLWCKLASLSDSVMYLPSFLAATRIYPETKTASGSWERIKEINKVLKKHKTHTFSPAIWGYLSYELNSVKTHENKLLQPLFWCLANACGLLGIENVIHHKKLRSEGRNVDKLKPANLPDGVVLPDFSAEINKMSPDEIRLQLL